MPGRHHRLPHRRAVTLPGPFALDRGLASGGQDGHTVGGGPAVRGILSPYQPQGGEGEGSVRHRHQGKGPLVAIAGPGTEVEGRKALIHSDRVAHPNPYAECAPDEAPEDAVAFLDHAEAACAAGRHRARTGPNGDECRDAPADRELCRRGDLGLVVVVERVRVVVRVRREVGVGAASVVVVVGAS